MKKLYACWGNEAFCLIADDLSDFYGLVEQYGPPAKIQLVDENEKIVEYKP